MRASSGRWYQLETAHKQGIAHRNVKGNSEILQDVDAVPQVRCRGCFCAGTVVRQGSDSISLRPSSLLQTYCTITMAGKDACRAFFRAVSRASRGSASQAPVGGVNSGRVCMFFSTLVPVQHEPVKRTGVPQILSRALFKFGRPSRDLMSRFSAKVQVEKWAGERDVGNGSEFGSVSRCGLTILCPPSFVAASAGAQRLIAVPVARAFSGATGSFGTGAQEPLVRAAAAAATAAVVTGTQYSAPLCWGIRRTRYLQEWPLVRRLSCVDLAAYWINARHVGLQHLPRRAS